MDNDLKNSILLNFLNEEFPWLGTDEEVSGADVIEQLGEIHERLEQELGIEHEDEEEDDE